MFTNLRRVIKTSLQHIARNSKLSAASILIMALTFFVSSLFLLAIYGANIVLNYFESQSQIIVFFNPDTVTQGFIDQVKTQVEKQNIPLSITYVSKADAYKKFLSFLRSDSPSLSQSVNQNKLPPSLEIKTANIDDLQKVANVLYSFQNGGNMIDKILYYKNVEDFLKQFILVVKFSAIAFISFLAGISLLIIWITIGIALTSHSDEIEIMQLVGATRTYIELPYILEGAVYGIIGSALSIVCLGAAYLILTKIYENSYLIFLSYFKGIPIPNIGLVSITIVIAIEIVIGALVGSIGSFIAVRSKLR